MFHIISNRAMLEHFNRAKISPPATDVPGIGARLVQILHARLPEDA